MGLGAHLVDNDDLPSDDGLHFTTDGQLMLGRRFATAMLGSRSQLAGDVNADGDISLADLNAVRNNFDDWGEGDATDGRIDLDDLRLVRDMFGAGQSAPAPEPGSVALLAIGGISARLVAKRLRRRTR